MIGLSHLYSIIYIHRIGQLVALTNTLKESKRGRPQGGILARRSTEGYGPLVRYIYLHCYIPPIWQDVYRREIVEVLCLCPELHSLANRPIWKGNAAPAPELSLLWAMQGHTSILPYIYPENGRLSIFDKLTTLRIHIDIGTYTPSYDTSGSQQIRLEQLESLICDVHTHEAFETFGSVASWKLPKLRKLSVHLFCEDHSSQNDDFCRALLLINAFGAELRYVLLDNTICSSVCYKLSTILTCCPKLEILCLNRKKCKVINVGPSFVHNSLRRVEFLRPGISYWGDEGKEHIHSFANSLAFPKMEAIVMQDSRFASLPLSRLTIYGNNFSVLKYLIDYLRTAGIHFLNENDEPITIAPGSIDDTDDSEDSDESDDSDDSDDSSYNPDETSNSSDTETDSEGEFETEDPDGDVLSSEEALVIYESMQ